MRLASLLALLAGLALAVAAADAAPDPVFAALVTRAFGPGTVGRESLYFKARFFTARLQAHMRYLLEQQQQEQSRTEAIALSRDDAAQLNEIVGEIWLASRKLYQSWGCLSYDLTLCDGHGAKGPKIAAADREAMAKWEARLGGQFAAGKPLSRSEAEDIYALARDTQAVLLANPEADRGPILP
ncbi:hypothetical protein H4R19_006010 [Coemansia spiralis]|nr:hypothetical protein H4R19_006010 [Coemansia spiralis]